MLKQIAMNVFIIRLSIEKKKDLYTMYFGFI